MLTTCHFTPWTLAILCIFRWTIFLLPSRKYFYVYDLGIIIHNIPLNSEFITLVDELCGRSSYFEWTPVKPELDKASPWNFKGVQPLSLGHKERGQLGRMMRMITLDSSQFISDNVRIEKAHTHPSFPWPTFFSGHHYLRWRALGSIRLAISSPHTSILGTRKMSLSRGHSNRSGKFSLQT